MIVGTHTILFTTDAAADRAFLRDVLGLGSVDDGGGWLIFRLPPSELACHPAEGHRHELYLICEDITAFVAKMAETDTPCTEPVTEDWGIRVRITLPGGSQLQVYESRHTHPD